MLNNSWFKKEAPLFTGLHFGFGGGAETAAPPQPFSGTGGTVSAGVSPGNGYTYHYFKSNGSFTVAPGYNTVEPGVNILVVAGGGGGGRRSGGGGGAGGLANATNTPIPAAQAGAAIPITVGEGGTGGTGTTQGSGGNQSKFGASTDSFYILADSGGKGGYGHGGAGGSGGGAQYDNSGGPATQPGLNPGKPWVSNHGNAGSHGEGPPDHNSGAGGGAGGAAGNGGPAERGQAGDGLDLPAWQIPLWMPAPDPLRPSINPLPGTRFSGGGGAGSYPTNRPANMPQDALQGGGGIGGPHTDGNGSAGINGLGGGGGGGAGSNPGPSGGNGGDGIVVIRYPT